MLTKTSDSNRAKTHKRYCNNFTLSDLVSVESNVAANEANRLCSILYPGSHHDVEHRAIDRGRGSYRTVQRWCHTQLACPSVFAQGGWGYMLTGDEAVISKAGEATHGRGRFYSSLVQRPISSMSSMAVSLIDVQARRSYPL